MDGVSAVDDVDGDITKYVVADGVIDTTKAGTHMITYTAVDHAGNKTIKIRTITVGTVPIDTEDNQDPKPEVQDNKPYTGDVRDVGVYMLSLAAACALLV